MKTDFTTAPLASGLGGADGGTVEKSQRAPYTKKLTLPLEPMLHRSRQKDIAPDYLPLDQSTAVEMEM